MQIHNCKIELVDDRNVVYCDLKKSRHEAAIAVNGLTRQLLKRWDHWVGNDRLNEREDLVLLGLHLYNLLFPPAIRNDFETDLDLINELGPDHRLRLTVVLHDACGELADFPWEFLYMPDREGGDGRKKRDGFFLAGQRENVTLTRFLPGVEHAIADLDQQLRILVVFSNPSDGELPNIDVDETRDAIEAIKTLRGSGSIHVDGIEQATYDDLWKVLREGEKSRRPHILHFIGHGDRDRGLAFKKPKDLIKKEREYNPSASETDWRSGQDICDLFDQDPSPRLVFLHACDGAASGTLLGFFNLARDLVREQIPTVVAMKYKIRTGDAARFTRVFYERIGRGETIDEAVRAGREALGADRETGKPNWGDRRFGTPVVYLQTERAIIELPADEVEDDYFDPNEKVACPNPHCDGKVQPGHIVCVLCNHEVVPCPVCESRKEYQLVDKTLGRCGRCGSPLSGSSTAPPSSRAMPESGVQVDRQSIRAGDYGVG